MLYISKIIKNDIYVYDTDDNTESVLSKKEIQKALTLGMTIQGAVLKDNKLYLKQVSIKEEPAIFLAKRKLVDSIWKSARLEGLGTTFPKTESILENLPVNTNKEEMLFIINMKRAWKFLFDNIDYPCNLMLLREFNKIVGTDLFYCNGEIRTYPVSIGGTSWVPDMPIESIIRENIDRLNSESNIRLKALKYFCYIARTQMFGDGNKRVAQLVANKILIESNIGIFQVPIEKIEIFKGLLIKYYETNNDTEIINFMNKYCIVTY